MPRRRRRSPASPSRQAASRPADEKPVRVRIVGGEFRGRRLAYSGDPRTRPMKDRTREAVFNLLGHGVEGAHAVDLFAGTGALGLEALSRGAASATFLERHVPTAKVLRENAALLGVEDRVKILSADTFVWARRHDLPSNTPWIVFCSPPYDFYVERRDEMLTLIGGLFEAAPPDSAFVIEADERFDVGQLPAAEWDMRQYPPARVAIAWKSEA